MRASLFINSQTDPRKNNALLQALICLDKNSYRALNSSASGANSDWNQRSTKR
jgi:hypothetical protein